MQTTYHLEKEEHEVNFAKVNKKTKAAIDALKPGEQSGACRYLSAEFRDTASRPDMRKVLSNLAASAWRRGSPSTFR